MRKTFWGRHPVFIFLLLHMAIVVLLAYTGIAIINRTGNLRMTAILIAAGGSITIYTTIKINRSLNEEIVRRGNEEISRRSKSLNEFSEGLKEISVNLDKYARDLERRENIIEEQQVELRQKVGVLNNYGLMMSELVAAIDSYQEIQK